LDFALVAMRRYLGLPRGTAFGLFALARTAGWIAHFLEQRRCAALIRPRASYVGPRPQSDTAAPNGRIIRFARNRALRDGT
jgi:citrate synthase